jgi:hypothetical protein
MTRAGMRHILMMVFLGVAATACSPGARVRGRIETADHAGGVQCRVDLRDPGYPEDKSLGTMVARAGQPFEGKLHDPQRSGLSPASDKQYVTVACDGYLVSKTPMFDRSVFVRELGLIVVTKAP